MKKNEDVGCRDTRKKAFIFIRLTLQSELAKKIEMIIEKKDKKIRQLPLSQSQTTATGLPKVDFSFLYSAISDSATFISNSELRRSPKKKKTILTERTSGKIEIVREATGAPDGRRNLTAFELLAKPHKYLYAITSPLIARLRQT
jgi:hypothetical protein